MTTRVDPFRLRNRLSLDVAEAAVQGLRREPTKCGVTQAETWRTDDHRLWRVRGALWAYGAPGA